MTYCRDRHSQGSGAEEAEDEEGLGMVSRGFGNRTWEGERYFDREHDAEGSQEQLKAVKEGSGNVE